MKRVFLFGGLLLLIAAACKKGEDNNTPANSYCASDATICLRLGDSSLSLNGKWYGILGNGRSFVYTDSIHDFSMDVGSSDVRSFALATGSLWSGGARMTYYNKRSGKTYKAYRGTVNITATDNGKITGTFDGAAKNTSNAQDTLLVQNGVLTAVPMQ